MTTSHRRRGLRQLRCHQCWALLARYRSASDPEIRDVVRGVHLVTSNSQGFSLECYRCKHITHFTYDKPHVC